MGRNLAFGDERCSRRKESLEWIKMSFWKYSITEGEAKYKSLWKERYQEMRKVGRSVKEKTQQVEMTPKRGCSFWDKWNFNSYFNLM